MKSKNKLFKWREAFTSEHGPGSMTRLVLSVLSFHMDQDGGSCFPSQRTLAKKTGLSHQSIYRHLKIAEKEGWILRTERVLNGQGWKRHGYKIAFPEKVVTESLHVTEEGVDAEATRFKEGVDCESKKVTTESLLSTSVNSSNTSVPEKNPKKPESNKPGISKKRESEAKNQNRAAATEIFKIYVKEIAPKAKNKQLSLHNISKHLEKYSRADLTKAITNYKPEAKGNEPKYRKTPSNFFGTKIGNEFFMDYLPGEFKEVSDADKPVNQQDWF